MSPQMRIAGIGIVYVSERATVAKTYQLLEAAQSSQTTALFHGLKVLGAVLENGLELEVT